MSEVVLNVCGMYSIYYVRSDGEYIICEIYNALAVSVVSCVWCVHRTLCVVVHTVRGVVVLRIVLIKLYI